ncbi:transporter substrate-binding domain-containing protein [Maridesulfovibrio sp.]|uniref:substrate-binding periplasmic protein n=1 Tax=Maridesulfovibrio sp. TaxID=2795000 RepID=UPI0029CA231D|nr:transporter substrate-binding domain-containing protein [Maridesulfovibrio sp.]
MYSKFNLNTKQAISFFTVLAVIVLGSPSVWARERLNIWYIDYPPYYLKEGGEATGLLVSRVNEIMKQAGVVVNYTCFPAKRILRAIKSNKEVASIGWFKTKEREKYAKFSLPIYTNKPVGVFALNAVADEIMIFSSLEDIMDSKQFKIGVIDGQSEGDFVDGLIKKYQHQVVSVTGKQVQLIRMLVAGRFDFILLPPEEVGELTKEAEVNLNSFSLLPMNDIPSGNKRYIMYSRSVSQEIIDRVNSAIVDLCH